MRKSAVAEVVLLPRLEQEPGSLPISFLRRPTSIVKTRTRDQGKPITKSNKKKIRSGNYKALCNNTTIQLGFLLAHSSGSHHPLFSILALWSNFQGFRKIWSSTPGSDSWVLGRGVNPQKPKPPGVFHPCRQSLPHSRLCRHCSLEPSSLPRSSLWRLAPIVAPPLIPVRVVPAFASVVKKSGSLSL